MKLVFIAIFSVILLVACEPQQDVIGDGNAPGLYYNFEKRYGWNVDNRHVESNRYEEVNRSYSLDRGRDSKKEYDSREQSERRDSERDHRLDHGRYNKDDSHENNYHRDFDRGQRLYRGRDNKDNYDSREQTNHRDSDRGRDDHRGYEHNRQRNDRHRDSQNENSENQRDNGYSEKRNHNTKYNYENLKNDRQEERKNKEGYDNVDNRGEKNRDDGKNRDHNREYQNNDRNQDKYRDKDHGYENRKDNKSREKNNDRDRNQGYGNEQRASDNNKNRNNESNNNGRQSQNENDRHRDDISKKDNKDNYDSREQTYHRDSDRGRDDHRGYEHNRQRNDRHRDSPNENSENQRDNGYFERRNHNTENNYENQNNDRQEERNYKEGYDNVDNRGEKNRDDGKNRDHNREYQKNDRNQDKYRDQDHGYENRKDNKSREKNNDRDRNQGYGNEQRASDNNKNRNNESNNNGRQSQNENDPHKEEISKGHGFERHDKDKNYKYDSGNYNYGSSKNQDRKENKYYESDNFMNHDDQQGNLHKDKEVYGPENSVQKADYNYKELDKGKQNTLVITEGYKDNKKDDRNPPYRYSYIESLITAPIQNAGRPNTEITQENKNRKDEFQDYPRKQDQEKKKKEEVIEIHGIISKNKDFNDKEVKVDVLVKKKGDTTQGKIYESARNLDHEQVNLERGIHIQNILNKGSPEKEFKPLKLQEGNKHENENIVYGQGNKNEKNYREGYNKHIQGKKDLLGGIELLGLIGNIGQELKEQVIERIPGYHLIQSLEHRGQKSEGKQPYSYNLVKKGPKIDLDVYSPELNEEKEKEVEKIQVYSEISNKDKGIKIIKGKEIDNYANTKDKKHKENYYQQGGRKAGYDYSINHKPVNSGNKNTDKYIEKQDYEYRVKINEGQKGNKTQQEREYYNYGNINQKDQENYNQQNSGNQSPNYLNQQPRDDQGLGYYNQRVTGYKGLEYLNQNNRDYINPDLGEGLGQGQGYWNQQDKINQVQDHKNKQKEDKYIYQYTIGNNLVAEQGFGKQGQINYNIPYFLPYDDSSRVLNNKQGDTYRQGLENRGEDDRRYNNYNLRYDYSNDKSDYETKPNEGWTYQGFQVKDLKKSKDEENNNNIVYNSKDGRDAQDYIGIGNQGQVYRNPQLTEVNNGYPDLRYINKGNPDYTPKFNHGIIRSGYDVYQPQHYPIPELVNPLSQQILGSVGKVQGYYNQNYTKSLANWDKHYEGYNVNPYLGEDSYPETYYSNNYQQSYIKPGYDTAYQSSTKEYMYQYQLPSFPSNNVFVRIGLPY